MRVYDPNAKCSKCGGEEVQTDYCTEAWLNDDSEPYPHKDIMEKTEHLDRLCTRCRFIWVEAVLESEKPNES